ncbi:BatA and WFA domain-containing protein [Luteolibacter flavescens]|uniref:BatA and WFA domain-containing protein n=1 Tax=Luteolibacter flavescens TaxID=1859460 RepID=A0ABT3FRV7_9BACT|nr:VWA domain-containing protein [Luteolibacter flavescens]MCW1886321.1 BatA and WFA domain-containing protein [Luteolibacter flavescens]
MLPNLLLFTLGIAAIGAPVWVHLRLGRVKKRATVSSLRLMRATPQTSRSPRRFVDIPLLLLRALVLLLVALGFGRLLVPGMRSHNARAYAAIVVDVSGSMQAEAGGKVWDQAKAQVLASLEKLDASSRVAVILSPAGRSVPSWESPAQAATRVAALEPGYGANQLAPSVREGVRLLAEMPEDRPKVLHLVSDFQRSALAGLDEVKLPVGVGLEIAKLGATQGQNRGVTVEVVSAGATDLGIYSFNDGTGGKLVLDENGSSRELEITPGNSGVRLGHAGEKGEWVTRRLELQETDGIAADNVAHDVYQAQDYIPVWLWEPPSEAKHVYEQASYYISRALQPVSTEDGRAVSRYLPVALTESNISAAVGELGTAAAPRLLFVPATASPSAELAALVKGLVENGGSVVFFGGPALDADEYAAAFGEFLPVRVGKAESIALTPSLAEMNDGNLLWGPLESLSRRQLEKAPLRQRHAVELAADAAVLASYADGVAFVAERVIGSGRTEFVNTSANRAWGDWAASAPLFVPAMHLLAARSLGDAPFQPAHQPVAAGAPVTLKLGTALAGRTLKLGEATYTVGADGRATDVIFDKPGVVDLTLDDGTSAGKIAVNFPTTESVLESDPEPVVRQRLESLRQSGSGSTVRWEAEEQGGLAWRLCLLAAALLLVIEPVVANLRMKP